MGVVSGPFHFKIPMAVSFMLRLALLTCPND
jgi:hypothetical protein